MEADVASASVDHLHNSGKSQWSLWMGREILGDLGLALKNQAQARDNLFQVRTCVICDHP